MDQKIALVTGSTSGIGKAVANLLLKNNLHVIVSSEKALKAREVKELFSGNNNVTYLKCDISVKEEIEKLHENIKSKFGKLNLLVANAGVMPRPCGIDDITDEVIDKTINTNLIGTFWTLKILGKLIQQTTNDGSIVCTTSVDGIIGEPYGVIYSATKAGIISLIKSFARYYNEPLVRVNAVAPGLIDTPLTATTGEDPAMTTDLSIIKRMGRSEEIAEAIVFLLENNSSFITGQILTVDGGFTLK